MSQPHQSARNTIAPTVRKTPTPLTNDERTVTSEVWIGEPARGGDRHQQGKGPELRVSIAMRTVWFLPGFEGDVAVGAVGEQELVAGERDADRDLLVGVVAERERDVGLAGR